MSGGKTQTSTQKVTIPPEVMARYNAVNARAEQVADQPFQAYSYNPNAFVAPLTPTQISGIQNVNQTAGMAQPYFNAASAMTLGGAQGVGPLTQGQIGYYQNPFTQAVVGSTLAGLQQQQGQQLSQQQAEAIKAKAFGGDRAGIQRAQLMGQQNLTTAQAIAPLYLQGYQQAVQTAAGQQGVLAQDLQRQLAAGQQLGGLGASAQQAALAGAQAQLGAGTAEQQTQQAGLQALYNQFLQERGYPFQVAQFLANIAMGTGALSGSTTTTTQPAPFFSDEDNKRNIRQLGKDPNTGLNVIAYDDADDLRNARETGEPMPPKRVSYSAQEIEERAPGLVSEVGGNKVVGMARGGLSPLQSMGGYVDRPGAYASGGAIVAPEDMRAILAAIGAPLEFYGGKGLYGGSAKGGVGSAGYVPASQMATPKLVTAGGLSRPSASGLSQAAQTGSQIAELAKMGQSALLGGKDSRGLLGRNQEFDPKRGILADLSGGRAGPSRGEPPAPKGSDKIAEMMPQAEWDPNRLYGYRGGLMRAGYDLGGSLPYGTDDQGEDPLKEVVKEGSSQKYQLATPGKPPSPTPGLGSELLGAANLAKAGSNLYSMLPAGLTEGLGAAASGLGSSLAGAGSAAASGLAGAGSALAAGGAELLAFLPFIFSDERMKENAEPVGELYDGQQIYRYNMKGSPKTQLGLMAQDVERDGHGDAVAGLGGLKMVDYKRATDVAAGLAGRNRAYRGGYQEGGLAEEDLPIVLAALQERDAEAPPPAGVGIAPRLVMSDAEPVREPGLVVAQARTPDEPGATPVRSDEPPAPGVAPRPNAAASAAGVMPPTPPVRPEEVGDLSPQALRAYTAERARALGIDPNFATAVFQGESGFRANARGDDNSSFNVAQLHYGNASERYPRPGLGDVFTRETGLDARDPNNARAVIDWSLQHAAKNGWNAWTVARNLMRKQSAPAGVAGGVAPPSEGRASAASGDGSSGIMDTVMSERFLVPALAGLGAMLSSKSPYLLGAVGEGLVGGTGAYTALQKQSADILKQRFDIARNVFRGPVMNEKGEFVWEDTRTGEMLTQSEYQRRFNAFLTGRGGDPSLPAGQPPRADRAAAPAAASTPAPAAASTPAPASAPSPAATAAPPPPAAVPAVAAPAPDEKPAASPPAAPPSAEPNVARMRQQALENLELWKNTDPSMNPRVLLPQVANLDSKIKELEQRAGEASKLATRAAERSPQQGTIYQNQATNLLAQAAKLREEMREKLARANQSLDQAVQLEVEGAKTRQTGVIQREFLQEIGPDGTKISLPPGTSLPPRAVPPLTEDQRSAPEKAQVDPRTGNLVLARPRAPAGGGLILPDLPPGAKVTELSPVAKNQIEVDGQFQKDFMEKAPSIGQARQRYMGLINAFKLFESGSTAGTRAGWAAVAETFGYPDIARSIINGEPASAQWVEKIGPNLVLDTLKAATPRFAQSEFVTLQDKGTPEPNKLPQTNFQMVKEGLALLNRSEAFIRAWDRASREEGWRSPSAYYSAWGQANPLTAFEEAVERQMGNFKGMPLPSSNKWVPGAIYTVPSNLPAAQRDALARYGLRAGDPFQYLGPDAPADQRIRKIEPRQLYSVPAMGK